MKLPLNRSKLLSKLFLLFLIIMLKFKFIKIIWIAKKIPLNSYTIELLEDIKYEVIGSFCYKKIADPTGEWRFYIPSLDEDAVYRIRLDYGRKSNLPKQLDIVTQFNGRLDENRYREIWEEGKTIFDERFTTNSQ